MKFQSALVLSALSAACLPSNLYTDAFAPSMSVRSRPAAGTAAATATSALQMVATTEVVDEEIKPRKTREVRYYMCCVCVCVCVWIDCNYKILLDSHFFLFSNMNL